MARFVEVIAHFLTFSHALQAGLLFRFRFFHLNSPISNAALSAVTRLLQPEPPAHPPVELVQAREYIDMGREHYPGRKFISHVDRGDVPTRARYARVHLPCLKLFHRSLIMLVVSSA